MSSTLSQLLLSTTTPTTTDGTDDDDGRTTMLWTVYVLLTIFLVCLAIASFVHYHLQNRSKYGDKQDIGKETDTEENVSGNRPLNTNNEKYRVTLGRNGFVPTPESGGSSPPLITTSGRPFQPPAEEPDNHQYHQRTIQVQESPRDGVNTNTKNKSPNGYIAQVKHELSYSPPKACPTTYYVNEGYDRDSSNCDSDKSLINNSSPPPPPPYPYQSPRKQPPPLVDMLSSSSSSQSGEMVKLHQQQQYQQKGHKRKNKKRGLQRRDTPLSLPDNSETSQQSPRCHPAQMLDHSWPSSSERSRPVGERTMSQQNITTSPVHDKRRGHMTSSTSTSASTVSNGHRGKPVVRSNVFSEEWQEL